MEEYEESDEWNSLMTNAPPSEADVYRQAAINTGLGIRIEDKAYDNRGRLLPNYIALYATERRDYSRFWNEVERLRREIAC